MEMTMACAGESRAADEQLAGTFKPADTFFLIECNLPDYGGWAGETVKMAAKSGAFAPFLAHLQRAPRGKVLFIRRPQSTGMNFYIALTNQAQPRIYHSELSDYADLLSLEIAYLAEDETPHIKGRPLRQIDELYTVCTNGPARSLLLRLWHTRVSGTSRAGRQRGGLADYAYRRASHGGDHDRFSPGHRLRACRSA